MPMPCGIPSLVTTGQPGCCFLPRW